MCVVERDSERFAGNDWAEVFTAEYISNRNGFMLQPANTDRVNDG